MKLAVIDIQGFVLYDENGILQFFPKELTVLSERKQMNHYLLEIQTSFKHLSTINKALVKQAERTHGLSYSGKGLSTEYMLDILYDILFDFDVVYVIGEHKLKFLQQLEEKLPNLKIQNLEASNLWNLPILEGEIPLCLNHTRKNKNCTSANCVKLFEWVSTYLLPHKRYVYL